MRAALALAIALAPALATGCRGRGIPTERAVVVRVAAAPGLSDPSASAMVDRVVRWGEVYRPGGARDLTWTGSFAMQTVTRVGFTELRRSFEDAPRYAATADLLEADVPTPSWLCGELALDAELAASCEGSLRRLVPTETTLVAFVPCWREACPILALDAGRVTRATLPGLSDARVVSVGGKPVVLARSNWQRSRAETGSDLVALAVSPPLARLGEIHLDRTDARDPTKVVYEHARASVVDGALVVEGRRATRDRVTNEEIAGEAVNARLGIGPDGKLAPR